MNRFTERLDAIQVKLYGEYITWCDLNEILPSNFVQEITEYREKFDFYEFIPIKALLISLIANMSDEDLKECFDI